MDTMELEIDDALAVASWCSPNNKHRFYFLPDRLPITTKHRIGPLRRGGLCKDPTFPLIAAGCSYAFLVSGGN